MFAHVGVSGGEQVDQSVSLSVSVVKKIQENTSVSHTLPVSYRYDVVIMIIYVRKRH